MSKENTNSEFLELLTALADSESFNITLTDKNVYKFKQLTTNDLKQLIKTVVDSPLTQSQFNSTLTKIMKQSLQTENTDFELLNIFDRLLYCIETRIQSISPVLTMFETEVNLQNIKHNLEKVVSQSPELFETQTLTKDKLTITYGIPFLQTDVMLNEYLSKHKAQKIENAEDLRNVLGEAFLNEIAKTLYSITIDEKPLDFLTVDFATRLKLLEQIPAHFIQEILTFIEKYKKAIDDSLQNESGVILAIDGSLFSMR
jgi:hypothetical protein